MKQKQIALVTGTSSGFGMLTAIELAKQGYVVIATMRDIARRENLQQLAIQHKVNSQISYLPLDVTNEKLIGQTITQILEQYGKIDVLVNNAGVAIGGFGEEVPREDWDLSMETNFFGPVALAKAVLPHMREMRSGKIINVSSVSGRVGFPGYGPYAASKFAIEGFSESLRLEMLPYGVHVVLVEPGVYQTDIWSKGFDQITMRTNEYSPYKKPINNILTFSKKLLNKSSNPQQVAKKITQIAKSNYPKLRYPLGRGSRIVLWVKALLPYKWFERIISSQTHK